MIQVGYYDANSPGSFGDITSMISRTGFTPSLLSYYTTAFSQAFPAAFAEEAAGVGASVLVQWQPRGTTIAAIAAGQEDAVVKAFAGQVKAVNHQVWISFAQEMNGNWYDWGVPNVTAASYVTAYRRIHGLFAAAGVTNVTWVWGPNVAYNGSAPFQSVYPGDAYVDVIGLDGYFGEQSDTFDSVFGPSIAQIRGFTGKPMMITETGVTGAAGASQIEGVFAGMSLYGFIAIVYFNQKQSGDAMHQDWDLRDNAATMAAFKAMVALYAAKPLIY